MPFPKLLTTLLLLCASLCGLQAQDFAGPAAGMGGAVAGSQGAWMLFHNQAGAAGLENWEGGVFVENRFLSRELNNKGIYFAKAIKRGQVIGVNFRSFGFKNFADSKLGINYAQALSDQLRIGVQLNYNQLRFGDIYGSAGMLSFEGGAQYDIHPNWTLGFHITNPIRRQWKEEGGAYTLNQKLDLALLCHVSEKVDLAVQAEKNIREKVNIRVGIDYAIAESAFFRMGYASFPSSMHMGLGLSWKGLQFHVASAWNQALGISPQLGLSYAPAH